MKEYLYKQATPFVLIDTTGKQFELKEDDVVTLCGDGLYEYRDHKFALTKETLRSHFDRIYNASERDRYNRVYERAMVGAMQGMIIHGWLVSESSTVAENAIDFADALVNKLKERDF